MDKREKIRIAKVILADGGIKIWQKYIQDVKINNIYMTSNDGGTFPHRVIYRIIMKDGIMYEATQETVDEDGKFSRGSSKFITKEIRKYTLD